MVGCNSAVAVGMKFCDLWGSSNQTHSAGNDLSHENIKTCRQLTFLQAPESHPSNCRARGNLTHRLRVEKVEKAANDY